MSWFSSLMNISSTGISDCCSTYACCVRAVRYVKYSKCSRSLQYRTSTKLSQSSIPVELFTIYGRKTLLELYPMPGSRVVQQPPQLLTESNKNLYPKKKRFVCRNHSYDLLILLTQLRNIVDDFLLPEKCLISSLLQIY